MLVDSYLHEAYVKFMRDATKEMVAELDSCVDFLIKWGERHGAVIKDVDYSVQSVQRVFEHKGVPVECLVDVMVWPLEKVNIGLLADVDRFIVEAFRLLKSSGFSRPSVAAYGGYWGRMWSKEFEVRWKENFPNWRGVYFVGQRLKGAAYVAARYEFGERFGPRSIYKDGELVGAVYDGSIWRTNLVRRGLLKSN